MTPQLSDVKEYLNIDFDDHDNKLSRLLEGEIKRAENHTGRNYTDVSADDYEVMNMDVSNAVIRGVANKFLNVDNGADEGGNDPIYTYFQNSTNPLF